MSQKTKILNKVRKLFTNPPLEKMLLSAVRGADYQGFWPRLVPNPGLYDFKTMRRVERNGIEYDLDLSCLMQWYVYWDLKEKPRERLYSMIKPGDVILDIGTNIGETLLNFAKITGETGYVYGFEPDKTNFANAQRNIALNKFNNIHVFNLGVAEKAEKLELYRVDAHNLGMNRILNATDAANFTDHTTIETDRLDNIVAENGIDRVDLIKIDIEGYEMHALRGAKEVLERFHPKLFIEVGYTRLLDLGTSPNEMMEYLQSFGYTIFHAETDEEIAADHDFSPLGVNGIAVYAVAEAAS